MSSHSFLKKVAKIFFLNSSDKNQVCYFTCQYDQSRQHASFTTEGENGFFFYICSIIETIQYFLVIHAGYDDSDIAEKV